MKGNPKISIITVVLNGEGYLEKTIQSVINQNYNNIEYIVIDGDSTDDTVNIIKRYEHGVDYWVSEPDFGIYDAMNKGIEAATGEWIHFMNTGDTFCNKLIVSEVFSKDYGSEIITGFVKIVDSHGVWKGYRHPNVNPSNCNMIFENCIAHQATFVSANVFDRIGKFSLNYEVQADYDFWVRAQKMKVKFQFINKDIACFLDNGISSSRIGYLKSIAEKNSILYDNQYISKIRCIFNILFEWVRFLLKTLVRFFLGETLSKFISENNLIKANYHNKKKIIFDLSVKGATRAGVHVFAKNILNEMLRISSTPILVCNNPFDTGSKKGLKRKIISILRLLYMEIISLFSQEDDIIVFPASEVPFSVIFLRKRYIVTIHDLFALKNPGRTRFFYRWKNKLTPYIVKNSVLVCTVSDYSRKEINDFLQVDLNKILVVYNGLNALFMNSGNNKKNEFMENENYILNIAVNIAEPRKNIEFLLSVFEIFKRKYVNNNLKLVLTGSESWESTDIFRSIKNSEFYCDILILGYVDNDKLPSLYKNAKAMVFPSIAEGFGIPVIESLSQGTPVIINNNTALNHFKGYGATVLDNFNADEWAAKLNNIIENLTRIDERDVRNVINSFSWKKSSRLLLDRIDKL